MTTVDSKGRVVLPQEVRDRLGITPGTEVEIREEHGKAVVELEDDPEQIIERMERLVDETAVESETRTARGNRADPIAQKHEAAVRSGAEKHSDE